MLQRLMVVLGSMAIVLTVVIAGLLGDNLSVVAHEPTPTPTPSPTPIPVVGTVMFDDVHSQCDVLAEQVKWKQAEEYVRRGYVVVEYRDVEKVKSKPVSTPDEFNTFGDWAVWVTARLVELENPSLECEAVAIGSNGAETEGTLIREGGRIGFKIDHEALAEIEEVSRSSN